MIELQKSYFENARSVFKGFDFQITVRAVIDGTSPGKIWVDDIHHPDCGFMATSEGWFLAGNSEKDEFNNGLKDLVHDMILRGEYYSPVNPEFLAELFFHIDTEKWMSKFAAIFDIRPPLPSRRIHFICSQVTLDWKEKIPEDYILLPVDSKLNIDTLEFPEDVRKWMMHNLEHEKKSGFGICLVHKNEVVVWVNAVCASGDECEIGIITTEEYRKRGLGSLTAAAAVDHCFSLGYSVVGWHADDGNDGSIAVAKKVGFVKERDYVHYICMFSESVHFAESGMRHFFNNEYEDAISDFENAFRLGEVPDWSYILTARSYGAMEDPNSTLKYLILAKEHGWNKWDRILQNEKLQSLFSKEEWIGIVSILK